MQFGQFKDPFWKRMLLFCTILLFALGCSSGGSDDGDDDDDNAGGWSFTNGPLGGSIAAFLPNPNALFEAVDQVYAIGPGGIYYSTNGGTSWNTRNDTTLPAGEIQSIAGVASTNSIFVGIKNQGVYLSTDAGDTWTSVNGTIGTTPFDPSGKSFYALAAISPTLCYVGVSYDNGTTNAEFYAAANPGTNDWIWTARNIRPGTNPTDTKPTPKRINAIVRRTASPQTHFYVATDVDVFYTQNSGSTWLPDATWITESKEGLYQTLGDKQAYVYSLALIRSHLSPSQDILYAGLENLGAGEKKLIWIFDGKKWESRYTLNTGTSPDRVTSLQGALMADTSHRMYAGFANRGLYFSENASLSAPVWTAKNKFADNTNILNVSVTSLFVGIGEGTRAEDVIYRGNSAYGLLYEDDNKGFEIRNTGLKQSQVRALAIHNTNIDNVLAATNGGIYAKDAADNWTRQASSIQDNFCQYMSFAGNADLTVLYAANTQRIMLSQDGGATWTGDSGNITLDATLSTMLAANAAADKVWASNAGKVWYRNAKDDWKALQAVPASPVNSLAFAETEGTLYAGTKVGIHRNVKPTDLAQAWDSTLNTGLLKDKVIQQVAVSASGNVLVASVLGEGLYYYDPTRAGWELRSTGLTTDGKNIRAIVLHGSEVYVGTDDGVWYKADIAQSTSWKSRNSHLTYQRILSMVMLPSNANVLYLGTDGNGIWKTTTNGQ